jgi:glycerate dehydrogenase
MTEHVVFLDSSTLLVTPRRPAFEHTWEEFEATAADQVVERARDATIVITNKVPLPAEVVAQLPKLKLVAMAATGYNLIDVGACRRHGAAVTNIRNYAVNTVPEHVFAMLLAIKRNLVAYRSDVICGRWQQASQFCFFDHPITDLHGSTMGIFGAGTLGRATANIARAFGMNILFAENVMRKKVRGNLKPVERVLAESDVISLHCPLTPGAPPLIGAEQLRMMKPTAILINTARGGLVDEAALAAALQDGTIGGAGFDVLTTEPPKAGNPLLDLRVLQLPNFILTPHVAWASDDAMQCLAEQLIDNIEAFVNGTPQNLVT